MVAKFLNYQMVDGKSVSEQVQEFQLILHGISVEGMVLPVEFQAASVIEKLPPSWSEFKCYLKLKKKNMSFANVIQKLQIHEGSLTMAGKIEGAGKVRANLMES